MNNIIINIEQIVNNTIMYGGIIMNRFLRSIFVLFATIVVTFSPGKIKTVVDFYYQGDNFIVCAQAWKELGADLSLIHI